MLGLLPFGAVWAVDFEFSARPGERPQPPVCMVARELKFGRTIRLWEDEFGAFPPFSMGPDSLYVAFAVNAELGCHLALGWPFPTRILDLRVEQLWLTNNLNGKAGKVSLLSTLTAYGLDGIGADEKAAYRDLAIRGGPYTPDERAGLLDYCEGDVIALQRLMPKMLPHLDLERALIRGRYMAAVTRMEWAGVPLDTDLLKRLEDNFPVIQGRMIERVNNAFGVYEDGSFREKLFQQYLDRNCIPWPRLASGHLALDQSTFRSMKNAYPQLTPLYELRHNIGKMRLRDFQVGKDGRNRAWLNPFGSRTGRNQPSNKRFIFGPSVAFRGLIKPGRDHAVAYLDYKQQEFGIAAVLSRDKAMQEAYRSGDPYLSFAKLAGDVPEDGTADEFKTERDLYKQCVLATQYGQGAVGLSQKIGKPEIVARRLLRLNHEAFPVFWSWSEEVLNHALLTGKLHTVLGWQQFFPPEFIKPGEHRESNRQGPNPRSILNFPMQGNGSEMLRIACCLGTEAGVEIVAPIHDAVMIHAHVDEIDAAVEMMLDAMAQASKVILNGFELGVDAQIIRYPDRYMDEKRGRETWDMIIGLLEEAESVRAVA
jgi:DNA polymerase family A